MALAIFDLDHTLLAGDSDHAWGQFLVEAGLVDADAYARENARFYDAYRAGRLDIHAFAAFAFEPLVRLGRPALDPLRERFLREVIDPMVAPAAPALLERHRMAGDTLLIVTATNRYVTERIAAWLDVDDLLATDLEERDGAFTGRIAGIPCFRDGKVTRLRAWLDEHGGSLGDATFYSDSHNDLPLLEAVARPVAVDPDDALGAEAARRGWPVVSLREAPAAL